MTFQTHMRRFMGFVCALSMIWVQSAAIAQDAMRSQANAAEAFARGVLPAFPDLATQSGGSIILNVDTSAAQTVPLSEFYPDVGVPVGPDANTFFGSDEALRSAGSAAGTALETQPGVLGEAWRTAIDSRNRPTPNLVHDQIFNHTGEVLDGIGTYIDEFTDCSVEQTLATPRPREIRVTEEHICTRRIVENARCEVNHTVSVTNASHDINFSVDGFADRVDVDLASGSATIRKVLVEEVCTTESRGDDDIIVCLPEISHETETLMFPPLDRDKFCGAGADSVIGHYFDNSASVPGAISCSPGLSFTMAAPPAQLHCVVPEPCENDEGNTCGFDPGNVERNCTVTGGFSAPVTSGIPYDCRVDDGGELPELVCESSPTTSSFEFLFHTREITEDRWEPQSCSDRINGVRNAGCSADIEVTRGPVGENCIGTGGGQICAGEPLYALLNPAPFDLSEAMVSRLDRRVVLEGVHCPIATGSINYTDIGGNAVAVPVSSADPLNADCEALRTNPSCSFRTTMPVDGSEGINGHPLLFEDVYDCGDPIVVGDPVVSETLSCPGSVRGLGNDLISQPREASGSFAEAAGRLSALRFMAMDTSCGDDPGESPLDCRVFEGDGNWCKLAVFGYVNCCDSPGGISLGDYLALAFAVAEVDGAIRGLSPDSAIRGAYEAFTGPVAEPLSSAWSAVSEGFASNVNSVFGTTVIDTTEAATSGLITSVQQALMQQAAEWTAQVFGDAAANAVFQIAGEAGAAAAPAVVDGVVQTGVIELAGYAATFASVLSVVMIAYTIYQVATLLIEIIWACEDNELELAVKRDLRAAHYIGTYCAQQVLFVCIEERRSYCTFASPLSRIIQQQVRPQLGLSWGTSAAPDCRGLTVGELNSVDWAAIDLSEWVAILLSENVIPQGSDINLANLTGAGHTLAGPVQDITGVHRQPADQRVLNQASGFDFESARESARRDLQGALP